MSARTRQEVLRIGELAERAGVSVATIKYYIREGLLPPPPIKTGRTMGYYDQPYLERLLLVRRLREEHLLPVRAIRSLLANRGDRPLSADEAALLARVGPQVVRKLEADAQRRAGAEMRLGRQEILDQYQLRPDELDLLEQMGLVGARGGSPPSYDASDVELLDALQRAEAAGLTRERFPVDGLAHYVELLGELARREVRVFTQRAAAAVPPEELDRLAEIACEITEPIVAILRRKLILRAVREQMPREAEA